MTVKDQSGSKPPPFPAYGESLRLRAADDIIAAGIEAAQAAERAMVIAVVDAAGDLIALKRMDQAHLASIDVAIAKARCAARYRRATKVFQEACVNGSGAASGVLSLPGVLAVEGGVPLVRGGQIVGAVGVSGGTPAEDGIVAGAAAQACGALDGTRAT